MSRSGFNSEHVAFLTCTHEWVHTQQGYNLGGEPPPYLWPDHEWQARNLAYDWFTEIFSTQPPTFPRSQSARSDLKDETSDTMNAEYIKLEEREASLDAQLKDTDPPAIHKQAIEYKRADSEDEMEEKKGYFRDKANIELRDRPNLGYHEDAELGCLPQT